MGEFFSDILIKKENMKEGMQFDSTQKKWIWNYVDPDDEDGNVTSLYVSNGEKISFQVMSVEYFDSQNNEGTARSGSLDAADSATNSPMVVQGDIYQDGLGLLSWWEAGEEEDEEEEGEGEETSE